MSKRLCNVTIFRAFDMVSCTLNTAFMLYSSRIQHAYAYTYPHH